ncbi:MAG: FtsX-like permease family protein, partial [Myxococcota bacterium]
IGLALYLKPDVDAESTVRSLQTGLEISGLYVRSNRTLRKRVFEIFEQTFAITRLLQAMSLVIAAFGITLTLFVIARERRSELALYRALGATRRQVFRLFVGKGAALGGLGTAIGIAGGVTLALILVFIINRELFGWTIQVFVPWWALAEQILTVTVVALFAAAIPALRASETPAGELTRDAA